MSDRGRLDQFVGECLVKAAHIILVSRTDEPTRPAPREGRKSWFNLQIDELVGAQAELELCRRDVLSPLHIEIYLQPWSKTAGQHPAHSPDGPASSQPSGSTLLEHWHLHYQQVPQQGRSTTTRMESPSIYKRMVIMLRSLLSYVRILPAFRIARAAKRDAASSFSLHYRISRSPPAPTAAATVARQQMKHFAFTPIETPHGALSMEVHYNMSATLTLDQMRAPAAQPQFISDYVGSQPGLGPRSLISTSLQRADTLLPDPVRSPPITTGAGILRTVSTPAPPLVRRHSWSLTGALQESGQHSAAQPAATGSRAAASGPPGQLSRQVAQQQQQQQQQQQMERQHHQHQQQQQQSVSFAPGTPGTEGAPRLASTPPRHPTSLGLRSRLPPEPLVSPAAAHAHGPTALAGPLPSEAEPSSVPKDEDGAASAAGSGGSAQRRSSAPVCIPNGGNGRACASSTDLWAMGQQQQQQRGSRRQNPRAQGRSNLAGAGWAEGREPCSAPATSHALGPGAGPATAPPTAFALAHAATAQAPDGSAAQPILAPTKEHAGTPEGQLPAPATPAAPPQMPVLPSETSSDTSSYPASCSPLLPFAFTPSQHSLASLPDHQGPGSAARAASPPMSGKAGLGALVPVRRLPSWSLRSSVLDLPPPALVGYSVSPMHDSLESSLWSGSTPRHPSQLPRARSNLPSPAPSPPTSRGVPRSGSSSLSGQVPRLTYPTTPTAEPDRMFSAGSEDTESDVLPFALDAETSSQLCPSPSRGAEQDGAAAVHHGSSFIPHASTAGGVDDEVGAFVRLLQDARPLDSSTCIGTTADALNPAMAGLGSRWSPGSSVSGHERSLQAGLDQLQAFKLSLQAGQDGPSLS